MTPPAEGRGGIRPAQATTEARLAECERQAKDAEVRYEPSRKMTLETSEEVRVVASLRGAGPGTTSGTNPVSTTVVPVPLECQVKAQLRGGTDFAISPEGFQEGSFLRGPTITWSWRVTARKTGQLHLTLEIASVAVINGRPLPGGGGLFTADIVVGTPPESLWDRSIRWSKTVVDHPLVRGFASLTLVAGALAAVWRRILKRPWPGTKSTGRKPAKRARGSRKARRR